MFFDDSKSVMCKVVSPKVDGEHALVSSTFRADRFLPIKDLNLHLLAPKKRALNWIMLFLPLPSFIYFLLLNVFISLKD